MLLVCREWNLSGITHQHEHRAPGQRRRAAGICVSAGDGGRAITAMVSKPYSTDHAVEYALVDDFAALGLVDKVGSDRAVLQVVSWR